MTMEQVFVADNPTQARMIGGYLESNGIPNEVRGEMLWSVAVEFIFAKGAAPSVWVASAQLGQAKALIQSMNDALTEAIWTCSQCGEQQGGQFTHCWQCGAAASPEQDTK